MKSIYTCPSCGAKTLQWEDIPRLAGSTIAVLRCENTRCTSKSTADGVEADSEQEAYQQLKRRVEEEK